MGTQDRINFDGWTLLRPTGELARGETRVRLQGQPLHVLEALLERPGDLVTREQLIAHLWPRGVVVDFDTALNSAIRRLRTALDDHADHPRYIETIPRRGYRFICPIDPVGLEHDVVSTAPVLAVAAGLHATASGHVTTPVAAGANQVAWASGRWWTRAGLAAMTLLALAGTAGWLSARPGKTADTAAMPAAVGTTVGGEARERYERGRFFFNRRADGDTARALALFQDALRLDPSLATAWAGIASVRWIDTMEGRLPRAAGLPLVREAAGRALALDPANSEALMRLTNYHWASGERAAAEATLQRAAQVAPDDPLVLSTLSSRALTAGRVDEAVALQRRAVQGDPLALALRHNLVVMLFVARRYHDARAEYRELSAIDPQRSPPDSLLGQSLLLGGDPAGALEYARSLPAGTARAQLEALSYFALGRSAEADAALQRLAATVPQAEAYRVAEVHAYRGETDAAFDWLRRTVGPDASDCAVDDCWPDEWVAMLPLLRTLHADPRWPAVRAALVNPPA